MDGSGWTTPRAPWAHPIDELPPGPLHEGCRGWSPYGPAPSARHQPITPADVGAHPTSRGFTKPGLATVLSPVRGRGDRNRNPMEDRLWVDSQMQGPAASGAVWDQPRLSLGASSPFLSRGTLRQGARLPTRAVARGDQRLLQFKGIARYTGRSRSPRHRESSPPGMGSVGTEPVGCQRQPGRRIQVLRRMARKQTVVGGPECSCRARTPVRSA